MKCGAQGRCSSGGDNMDELSLILVIKIYVCSNSKLQEVQSCVTQTIVEEGATGSQRWFGSTRGSTNSLWSHQFRPSARLIIRCCATCWWEISNVCQLCLRDLPHTCSCTYFYLTKKNRQELYQLKHQRALILL